MSLEKAEFESNSTLDLSLREDRRHEVHRVGQRSLGTDLGLVVMSSDFDAVDEEIEQHFNQA